MRKLVSEICQREGKRSQVKVGDVREVLSVLTDILAEELADRSTFYASQLQEAILKKMLRMRRKAKRGSQKSDS